MEKLKYVRSKWRNWKLIHSHNRLRSSQPYTMIYSKNSLIAMFRKYSTVFVKPDNSFGGKSVIRITKRGNAYFALGHRLQGFRQLNHVHRWIEARRKKRKWVIQQAVPLTPMNGRPVDIRTISQRSRGSHVWEVTAYFAKVAKKNAAVTNVKAGGRVIRVDQYLKSIGYNANERRRLVEKQKKFTILVSQTLAKYFPNRLYALDIGMDRKQKLWLIEVNTMPRFDILKKIDMKMYRRAIMLKSRR